MGRVRTKTVKKSAKVIIERYYPRLTLDFETNKRICDEIAIIASKRLRNKVSGRRRRLRRPRNKGTRREDTTKRREDDNSCWIHGRCASRTSGPCFSGRRIDTTTIETEQTY